MSITATINSHDKHNNFYVQSVKFTKIHNNSTLTDRQQLLFIIEQHGEIETWETIVKKFIFKLQKENNYNCMDQLIDASIFKTEELYNKLNVRIPLI